jgi:hypothetical protein
MRTLLPFYLTNSGIFLFLFFKSYSDMISVLDLTKWVYLKRLFLGSTGFHADHKGMDLCNFLILRGTVIFKKSIHLVDGVINNPVVSQVGRDMFGSVRGVIIIIFYLVLKSYIYI